MGKKWRYEKPSCSVFNCKNIQSTSLLTIFAAAIAVGIMILPLLLFQQTSLFKRFKRAFAAISPQFVQAQSSHGLDRSHVCGVFRIYAQRSSVSQVTARFCSSSFFFQINLATCGFTASILTSTSTADQRQWNSKRTVRALGFRYVFYFMFI